MMPIQSKFSILATMLAATVFTGGHEAAAQTAPAIPPAISTPDKVETRIGPLDFKDGMPSKETVAKVYDNQTRSMLDTPQRYPRAGSQSYPSPAAESAADDTTTVYFGPTQPTGVKRGNWIQTMPGKGYSVMLRLYSPLEPFFAKTWRPSEIEEVSQAGGRALR